MLGRRQRFSLLVAVFAGLIGTSARSDELDDYVSRPDPAFAWEAEDAIDLPGGGRLTRIKLTSQVWQGLTWTHRLTVVVPAKVSYPDSSLLFITGGGLGNKPSPESTLFGVTLANGCGAPVAVLEHVPNQPLMGGKKEDALIAHTFLKFLETGDASWPLLFPMAKSAVRAMDAVQAFAEKQGRPVPSKFVVTGASKRGWTTWLTSAVDDRVVGLAPMVIDTLNMRLQGPNQIKVWGKASEQIADYTENNLTQKLDDETLIKLWTMVDPYTFRERERLAKPKLLIHGTNDRYWTLNASTLYFGDLKGSKSIVYLPNAGHNLAQNRDWALNGVAALFRHAVTGRAMPEVTWTLEESPDGVQIQLKASPAPKEFQPWVATAPGRDFRDSKWEKATGKPVPGAAEYTFSADRPEEGNVALLVGLGYEVDGIPFQLTTQIAETTVAPKAAER